MQEKTYTLFTLLHRHLCPSLKICLLSPTDLPLHRYSMAKSYRQTKRSCSPKSYPTNHSISSTTFTEKKQKPSHPIDPTTTKSKSKTTNRYPMDPSTRCQESNWKPCANFGTICLGKAST